jgi:hypothetical protein
MWPSILLRPVLGILSMSLNHEASVVSATLVPENLRLRFLPEQFGKFMLKGEALVYGWLEQLSED